MKLGLGKGGMCGVCLAELDLIINCTVGPRWKPRRKAFVAAGLRRSYLPYARLDLAVALRFAVVSSLVASQISDEVECAIVGN